MTPEERSQRARIAALERWGRVPDRTAATAAGRRGRRAQLERLADPRGVMTPEQRAKAADALEQAHMERMSYRSRRVRGARIRATNDGESVEPPSQPKRQEDTGQSRKGPRRAARTVA